MRSLITTISLLLSIATVDAQTSQPAPTPAPAPVQPAPAAEPSIHGYGDRDKTCTAWTDTCRSCERGADDKILCSNIGIACQPAEITCTARKEAPAK